VNSSVALEALDNVFAAETPEGILLELRPAGFTVRFYAFVLDWLLRLGVLYLVSFVSAFMGGIGYAFWTVVFFALEWFYPVVFELSASGASPGKRAMKVKVVMDTGLPVTPAASLTRNLLRFADFLPFCFGFAIVSILLRTDCKRLGDLAAGTMVVHQPRVAAKVSLDLVAPLAPVVALAPRDQAALIALAARAARLTEERLDELAALAGVVSGDAGCSGANVTRRVLGVAQWLIGRRS
jgi:uncharacterized RDD family membrane protein YckC